MKRKPRSRSLGSSTDTHRRHVESLIDEALPMAIHHMDGYIERGHCEVAFNEVLAVRAILARVYTHSASMGKMERKAYENSPKFTRAEDKAHAAMDSFRGKCVKGVRPYLDPGDDSATKRFKLIEFDGAAGGRRRKKK